MPCWKALNVAAIGQKRMPKEHIAAGCAIQIEATVEDGDKFGFQGWSLTWAQAEELRDRLNYVLAMLCPEEPAALENCDEARPDHTLLLRQIVSGRARWEPFEVSSQGRGEVCVDGRRYVTHLDADGCPVVGEGLREALEGSDG